MKTFVVLLTCLSLVGRAEVPGGHGAPVSAPKAVSARSTAPVAAEKPKSPVEAINSEMKRVWQENGLTPSKVAPDTQFLRRATLDILGRAPTLDEIDSFLKEPVATRKDAACDRLADSNEGGPYWAKLWGDWLLETPEDQPNRNRASLHLWLAKRFGEKAGWDTVVTELLSGKDNGAGIRIPNTLNIPGNDQNGPNATAFLSESLGEAVGNPRFGSFDMVPATNRTSRLFLGNLVQCAQCHDHPTDSRFTQQRYWELNAFFRQTGREENTGKLSDLPNLNKQGFIYYENRRGQVMPASPRFLDGQRFDPKGALTRREALAKFVTGSDYFPKAFINRLWKQFFGDSLNAPGAVDSFDEEEFVFSKLMNELAEQFKKSGYQPRELMRWMCKSEPYRIDSTGNRKKDGSDHDLFSRFKMRRLNPEQITNTMRGALDISDSTVTRDALFDALFVDNNTDSDGIPTTAPKGDIQRALAMANSPVVHKVVKDWVAKSHGKSSEKSIRGYYWSLLGRPPNKEEFEYMKKNMRDAETLEDMVAVMLMSSEFQHNQ